MDSWQELPGALFGSPRRIITTIATVCVIAFIAAVIFDDNFRKTLTTLLVTAGSLIVLARVMLGVKFKKKSKK